LAVIPARAQVIIVLQRRRPHASCTDEATFSVVLF